MTVPQAALAVQTVLFLAAAAFLAVVAESQTERSLAVTCAVWAMFGQLAQLVLLVLDARAAAAEAEQDAAEALQQARREPSVPQPS